MESERYELNPKDFYLVECGGRKTSLDDYLYDIAVDACVKFHFNHYINSLDDVPEGSIMATGFNNDGMDAIGIKYVVGTGAYARKKIDDPKWDASLVGWSGKYTTDYGYLSVTNDMMFF